jgi:hypothetical protein
VGPICYMYPDELSMLPSFAEWLDHHVRMLRANNFPVPPKVIRFSCPPSEVAYSYSSMWGYGCHYHYDAERGATHVTFDSRIASIPSHTTNTLIDVGVLKSIISVQYAVQNIILMKGLWIMPFEEGQRTIKKDSSGFWTVKVNARHNPYVFPCAISQVFFMTDRLQLDWRVVI